MSGSWDDLLPVYFRMRLARWRSSSAVAYCFWLLKREQSYWSKRAASFTLNNRISSMSEVLFRRSNFAHKLILKTYLSRMYLAFLRQPWLRHFQKQTHKLLRSFEILPPSGPLWGRSLMSSLENGKNLGKSLHVLLKSLLWPLYPWEL